MFVAFTVHFEHKGKPISMLLDIVELTKSHSGENLADTSKKVLTDFGVENKVCYCSLYPTQELTN